MKLMLIDTSGPVCSAALVEDTHILAEFSLNNGLHHSMNLMPMVDALLTIADTPIESMDVFAAVTGPGSFTGVRMGVVP